MPGSVLSVAAWPRIENGGPPADGERHAVRALGQASSAVGASSLEELLFDQAERALDEQRQSVTELRARTGPLVALAALAGALLIAPAIRDNPSCGWTVAASACLAGSVLFGALIPNVPWRLVFVGEHDTIRSALWDHRADMRVVHDNAADFLVRLREDNRTKVNWMHWLFALGALLLALAAAFGVLART